MADLDAETKARIRAEEEERAKVRAELAAPAPAPKKAGLGCFGWGVLVVLAGGAFYACNPGSSSVPTDPPVLQTSTGTTTDNATTDNATASAPAPASTGLGDGTYTIGTQMQAGRWRTREAASNCY